MIRLRFGRVALALILSGFMLGRASATTITQWSFENNLVQVNSSPTPSSGTGTASSIGMNVYPTPNVGVTADDVVLGKSSDTGANGVADLTNTWRVRARPAPMEQPTDGRASRQSALRGPFSPQAPSATARSTSASIGTRPRRARPISNWNTPRTASLGTTCRSLSADPTPV